MRKLLSGVAIGISWVFLFNYLNITENISEFWVSLGILSAGWLVALVIREFPDERP